MEAQTVQKKLKPTVTPGGKLRGRHYEGQHAHVQSILHANRIQPKLRVGQPNDKYEQEADRVAEQVVRMPAPQPSSSVSGFPLINGTKPGIIQRTCAACTKDEDLIQAKTNGSTTPEVTPAIGTGIQSLQNGGQPLSKSERSFFEPRIGADFTNVRVHNDVRAASAAKSINARAFTHGRDVVFGAGEYSSSSDSGKRLLAHELTHVVPQGGSNKMGFRTPSESDPIVLQAKLTVSTPGDKFEQEADHVADAVMAGNHSSAIGQISQGAQPKLYRVALPASDVGDGTPLPESVLAVDTRDAEVQRSATQEGATTVSASKQSATVSPSFEQSLQQSTGSAAGQGLPSTTQSFMENRIGSDFSSVRVHHDTRANALASGINARAFTLGNNIFFAQSQYQPESRAGQHLLAHELTHVVQQSEGRLSRKIQRNTSCSNYPGYDRSRDLTTYNCAGLATRTYRGISPPSRVYDAITANFIAPKSTAGNCDPGGVKFRLWRYNLHFEDHSGAAISAPVPDFHIVGGRADASGADPTKVYSKNGKRPVYGPGTGPSFKPPAREPATYSNPSETPYTDPQGRQYTKVRSNMTEEISCAGCHP